VRSHEAPDLSHDTVVSRAAEVNSDAQKIAREMGEHPKEVISTYKTLVDKRLNQIKTLLESTNPNLQNTGKESLRAILRRLNDESGRFSRMNPEIHKQRFTDQVSVFNLSITEEIRSHDSAKRIRSKSAPAAKVPPVSNTPDTNPETDEETPSTIAIARSLQTNVRGKFQARSTLITNETERNTISNSYTTQLTAHLTQIDSLLLSKDAQVRQRAQTELNLIVLMLQTEVSGFDSIDSADPAVVPTNYLSRVRSFHESLTMRMTAVNEIDTNQKERTKTDKVISSAQELAKNPTLTSALLESSLNASYRKLETVRYDSDSKRFSITLKGDPEQTEHFLERQGQSFFRIVGKPNVQFLIGSSPQDFFTDIDSALSTAWDAEFKSIVEAAQERYQRRIDAYVAPSKEITDKGAARRITLTTTVTNSNKSVDKSTVGLRTTLKKYEHQRTFIGGMVRKNSTTDADLMGQIELVDQSMKSTDKARKIVEKHDKAFQKQLGKQIDRFVSERNAAKGNPRKQSELTKAFQTWGANQPERVRVMIGRELKNRQVAALMASPRGKVISILATMRPVYMSEPGGRAKLPLLGQLEQALMSNEEITSFQSLVTSLQTPSTEMTAMINEINTLSGNRLLSGDDGSVREPFVLATFQEAMGQRMEQMREQHPSPSFRLQMCRDLIQGSMHRKASTDRFQQRLEDALSSGRATSIPQAIQQVSRRYKNANFVVGRWIRCVNDGLRGSRMSYNELIGVTSEMNSQGVVRNPQEGLTKTLMKLRAAQGMRRLGGTENIERSRVLFIEISQELINASRERYKSGIDNLKLEDLQAKVFQESRMTAVRNLNKDSVRQSIEMKIADTMLPNTMLSFPYAQKFHECETILKRRGIDFRSMVDQSIITSANAIASRTAAAAVNKSLLDHLFGNTDFLERIPADESQQKTALRELKDSYGTGLFNVSDETVATAKWIGEEICVNASLMAISGGAANLARGAAVYGGRALLGVGAKSASRLTLREVVAQQGLRSAVKTGSKRGLSELALLAPQGIVFHETHSALNAGLHGNLKGYTQQKWSERFDGWTRSIVMLGMVKGAMGAYKGAAGKAPASIGGKSLYYAGALGAETFAFQASSLDTKVFSDPKSWTKSFLSVCALKGGGFGIGKRITNAASKRSIRSERSGERTVEAPVSNPQTERSMPKSEKRTEKNTGSSEFKYARGKVKPTAKKTQSKGPGILKNTFKSIREGSRAILERVRNAELGSGMRELLTKPFTTERPLLRSALTTIGSTISQIAAGGKRYLVEFPYLTFKQNIQLVRDAYQRGSETLPARERAIWERTLEKLEAISSSIQTLRENIQKSIQERLEQRYKERQSKREKSERQREEKKNQKKENRKEKSKEEKTKKESEKKPKEKRRPEETTERTPNESREFLFNERGEIKSTEQILEMKLRDIQAMENLSMISRNGRTNLTLTMAKSFFNIQGNLTRSALNKTQRKLLMKFHPDRAGKLEEGAIRNAAELKLGSVSKIINNVKEYLEATLDVTGTNN
jgi:hypothetical protein